LILRPQRLHELEAGSEENSCKVPDAMIEYLNVNVKIPDKDIKEKIMALHPVLENIRQVPSLDGYMKQLLGRAREDRNFPS